MTLPQAADKSTEQSQRSISPKSRRTALLLAIFLGYFGAHRFYVNKPGTGVLMILFVFLFSILAAILWWIADIITIATGEFKDKEGNFLHHWTEQDQSAATNE